jgi:hypothetical protein
VEKHLVEVLEWSGNDPINVSWIAFSMVGEVVVENGKIEEWWNIRILTWLFG